MHAPDLSARATLFGSDDLDSKPDQILASDIETTVRYGIRADHPRTRKLSFMPSFGGMDPRQEGGYPILGEAEIADLAEYLVVLQGQAGDRASAVRGNALFSAQGCSDCHARDAKGDPGIGATDLTSSRYLYGNDRQSIQVSIREGRKGRMPAYERALSPARIKAVSYYVFSIRESAKK